MVVSLSPTVSGIVGGAVSATGVASTIVNSGDTGPIFPAMSTISETVNGSLVIDVVASFFFPVVLVANPQTERWFWMAAFSSIPREALSLGAFPAPPPPGT